MSAAAQTDWSQYEAKPGDEWSQYEQKAPPQSAALTIATGTPEEKLKATGSPAAAPSKLKYTNPLTGAQQDVNPRATIAAPSELTGMPGTPEDDVQDALTTAAALGLAENPVGAGKVLVKGAIGSAGGGFLGSEIGRPWGPEASRTAGKIGAVVGGLAAPFAGEPPIGRVGLLSKIFGRGAEEKPEVVPITKSPYWNDMKKFYRAAKPAATVSEGETPLIAAPGARPPMRVGNEGRPATWTNERVLSEAAKGNREAISQATRRGLPLPTNARYVMGDPDLFRGAYNPREVTRFTPEGTPIRNLAPPERSTGASLVIPKVSAPVPEAEGIAAESVNPEKMKELVKSGNVVERNGRYFWNANAGLTGDELKVSAPVPEGQGIAARGLISEPPRTIPEQNAQSNVHLIQRMKAVMRDPFATNEERTMAAQRLKEMGAQ
jgi:hypothetical protein